MNIANFIFYVLLFIGFFLPTNSSLNISLPGVSIFVNELAFLLLPVVNLFCTNKSKKIQIGLKISKYIILYLILVFLTEFIFKSIVFNQSIGDGFKAFRIGIPFYSSILLLYSGFKADIKIIWKIILWAVVISVLLSIISLYIDLPIYSDTEDMSVLEFNQGRVVNSNAAFGIIGLYLLFADKDKWYNQGKLVKYASILSVIALVLSFNRTYLALMVLEFAYLAYKTLTFNSIFKILVYPFVFLIVTFIAYNNNVLIQRQIDNRILSILFEEQTLAESAIDGNRDMIYEGMLSRIEEGYWVIGLPYNEPIFLNNSAYVANDVPMSVTDTSPINVLLRYGIIPLLFWLLILKTMFKKNKSLFFRTALIIYAVASLNLDALFRHNSILFLIIIFYLTILPLHEKNYFYSKNGFKQ
ncbi:hypothetical protein [Flavobacterium sp. SM2513]|uniref:hypothetical protein n=1 Tax=Flavobacterium sp. SM2513 TaxID=3424766 RepID=UPI003D7FE5F3